MNGLRWIKCNATAAICNNEAKPKSYNNDPKTLMEILNSILRFLLHLFLIYFQKEKLLN